MANGGYLLGGAFLGGGGDDAGVILHSGGHVWQLVAFGLPAVAAGLYLWNGLGPHFGLGEARGKVDSKAAVGVAVALACVILVLLLWRFSGIAQGCRPAATPGKRLRHSERSEESSLRRNSGKILRCAQNDGFSAASDG